MNLRITVICKERFPFSPICHHYKIPRIKSNLKIFKKITSKNKRVTQPYQLRLQKVINGRLCLLEQESNLGCLEPKQHSNHNKPRPPPRGTLGNLNQHHRWVRLEQLNGLTKASSHAIKSTKTSGSKTSITCKMPTEPPKKPTNPQHFCSNKTAKNFANLLKMHINKNS